MLRPGFLRVVTGHPTEMLRPGFLRAVTGHPTEMIRPGFLRAVTGHPAGRTHQVPIEYNNNYKIPDCPNLVFRRWGRGYLSSSAPIWTVSSHQDSDPGGDSSQRDSK